MSATKKRKSVATSSSAAASVKLPELVETNEFIVYNDLDGKIFLPKDDVERVIDKFREFYVSQIRFYKQGFIAMRKSESGDVFAVSLTDKAGHRIELIGSSSGDGGWHHTRYSLRLIMLDAPAGSRVSKTHYSWSDEETCMCFQSYEHSEETAQDMMELVGLERRLGTVFTRQSTDIVRMFMRRAYAICNAQFTALNESSDEQPDSEQAPAIRYVVQAMETIGHHAGIRNN